MMDDLIEILHDGSHSLVVANGEICTFGGRGISDLYNILSEDPGFLQGAEVADKVVGKGAVAHILSICRYNQCSCFGIVTPKSNKNRLWKTS